MASKEIIIDGVDVSECIFYKGYCRIAALCDYSGHLCEVTPNCYFKQLKRKEEECEKYKKGFEEDFAFNNELINDKLQIGLEINRYKQTLEEIEKYQKRNCETCVYANTQKCNINCQAFVIFDIINKAKDGE